MIDAKTISSIRSFREASMKVARTAPKFSNPIIHLTKEQRDFYESMQPGIFDNVNVVEYKSFEELEKEAMCERISIECEKMIWDNMQRARKERRND